MLKPGLKTSLPVWTALARLSPCPPSFLHPSLCHNATVNQVKRTLEKPDWNARTLSVPRGFWMDELKGNPAARLQTVGLGAVLLQSTEHWQSWPRAYTMFIFSFPLQLAISLWSRYRGLCCQHEGRRIKTPQLLQHSITWGEQQGSGNGNSLGKAPRREQPLPASPHLCHSLCWSNLLLLRLLKCTGVKYSQFD